jgi:predicted DsbA family dithiol-disulfide isomerase
VLWKDYFQGMDHVAFFQELDGRGKELGVRFGPQPLMSNSRQALEAGEFAKEQGRYDAFHEGVFKAFFTDCKDIGDRAVLRNVAQKAGLDIAALEVALDAKTYLPRLTETTAKARENWVRAAPTFIIEGYGPITGAQPVETFRKALHEVAHGKEGMLS